MDYSLFTASHFNNTFFRLFQADYQVWHCFTQIYKVPASCYLPCAWHASPLLPHLCLEYQPSAISFISGIPAHFYLPLVWDSSPLLPPLHLAYQPTVLLVPGIPAHCYIQSGVWPCNIY